MSYRRLAAYVQARDILEAEEAMRWVRIIHDPRAVQRAAQEQMAGAAAEGSSMKRLLAQPSIARNIQMVDKLPTRTPPSPPSAAPPASDP